MDSVKITKELAEAVAAVQQGKVLAYPTEAVYGLGCHPENQTAVEQILKIKQRPVEKGMIMIAGDLAQLEPYLELSSLSEQERERLVSRQPRPTSWIVPCSARLPAWISGQFNTVAVRLTDHPTVMALCDALGHPLVSTSANLSGDEPATSAEQAAHLPGLDLVLDAPLGGETQPSQILDIRTGKTLRA